MSLPPSPDSEIIETLRSKDGQRREYACRTLYVGVGRQIRRWYLAKGASVAQAEDWVQETFLKMLRSLDQLHGDSRFIPWLWAIARNVRMDALRGTQRNLRIVSLDQEAPDEPDNAPPEVADPGPGPLESAAKSQYLECLEQAFQAFSVAFPDRAELLGWVVDGVPMDQIAVRRHKSAGAMREDLSQTRKKLRAYSAHCSES